MMTFRIKHKYCGCETCVTGCNVYDAMKQNGKDLRFWTVLEII